MQNALNESHDFGRRLWSGSLSRRRSRKGSQDRIESDDHRDTTRIDLKRRPKGAGLKRDAL